MISDDDDPTAFEQIPWHLRDLRRDARSVYAEDTVTVVSPRLRARSTRLVRVATPMPRSTPSEPTVEAYRPRMATLRPESRLAELVENLSLPPGLTEDMLPLGVLPQGEEQIRVAIVRIARDLGREYRQRGRVLRTDAAAVEAMQRHLSDCADAVLAGRTDPRTLAPEIARHGALLGEILVCRLGATWSNLAAGQPALWQMTVPPFPEVSPVARVHRYLLRRNREQDLVGFFLELDAASRRASHVTFV
jgi:hypothetical protein